MLTQWFYNFFCINCITLPLLGSFRFILQYNHDKLLFYCLKKLQKIFGKYCNDCTIKNRLMATDEKVSSEQCGDESEQKSAYLCRDHTGRITAVLSTVALLPVDSILIVAPIAAPGYACEEDKSTGQQVVQTHSVKLLHLPRSLTCAHRRMTLLHRPSQMKPRAPCWIDLKQNVPGQGVSA